MRTTSRRMLEGVGGWGGKDVFTLPESKTCDLIGFTMTSDRPLGHVGVIVSRGVFANSSSSRGFIAQQANNYYISRLQRIKRPVWANR